MFGGLGGLWKNKGDRKNLTFANKIRGVKVEYKITGLNLDNFINTLKNRGIALFDIKKLNNKQKKLLFHVKQ